ncbi:MAG: diguanylate cyclase [Lachnospiraceae bacterium]|nr:diguanylate cyclase [Lachnospiraceae bacterium]
MCKWAENPRGNSMEEKKHILMVDDVTTNLKCASEVLSDRYKVSMVKSGAQALKFLEKTMPDLILLDISMSDMDGYETLSHIKMNPKWTDIPVVFLTANVDGESEIKGLKMGAMDYIRKPFAPDVMLSRVEKILLMEEHRKMLELTAKKDALTGLWNRRHLEECIESLAAKKDATAAFLLIDLDDFKQVNDQMGHLVGDAVLTHFAKELKKILADEDIIFRIGGDEFVVLATSVTTTEEVEKLAALINEEVITRVNLLKGSGANISASIGISMIPDNGKDLKTVYNKSDKALYLVKKNGKNSYHFYQEREKGLNEMMCEEEESTYADLEQLKNLIREKRNISGAYEVEYEGFRRIFQFISRSVKRSKRNVQIVLFTLSELENVSCEVDMLERTMLRIGSIIMASLRKGDVVTQYSSNQYVVILIDTDTNNGKMVADRIETAWKAQDETGPKAYKLKYDIEQFETKDEKWDGK